MNRNVGYIMFQLRQVGNHINIKITSRKYSVSARRIQRTNFFSSVKGNSLVSSIGNGSFMQVNPIAFILMTWEASVVMMIGL